MDNPGIKVKSLHKAVILLDFFTEENPERGIKELAGLTGMLNSTVYNIMSTFQVCGVIEKNPVSGKYRLGKKILELARVMSATDDVKRILSPIMDRLAEECRETVFFAYPSGVEVIYIEAAFPRDSHFARAIAGVRADMYCTSIGKAILAHLDGETLDRVLASTLKRFTPNTITDPELLRRDIEETRQRGYSIDNMEHEYGIRCVGVPLFNKKGAVIGGLSVSGPSLRMTDEKLPWFAAKLQEAAAKVRELLP